MTYRFASVIGAVAAVILGALPAVAMETHMESLTAFIMGHPDTKMEDGAYVFPLVEANPKSYAQFRFTPASEDRPAVLSFESKTTIEHKPTGRRIECTNTMYDVGALGTIGPRDGSTTCVGGFGFSRLFANRRMEEYAQAILYLSMRKFEEQSRAVPSEPDTPDADTPEPDMCVPPDEGEKT